MVSKELEKLISQHGEAAIASKEEAKQIGDTYIIPAFGFAPIMQDTLDLLLAPRKTWHNGLVDIRVFAKPKGFMLFDSDEETIEIEIIDLLSLLRNIYPKEYDLTYLPDWWTQEDMLNEAEIMEPIDFAMWMLDSFLPEDFEEELLDSWLESLQPQLGKKIIFYKLEDDNDSNCGFAPYLFDCDHCIILVARCWEL